MIKEEGYSLEQRDRLNWTINKTWISVNEKTAEEKAKSKTLGYYPKLEQAALAMLEYCVKDQYKNDMEDIIGAIRLARADVVAEVQRLLS